MAATLVDGEGFFQRLVVCALPYRSQQQVSQWLRFLSPPTATWVVPASTRSDEAGNLFSRRPAASQRIRAPPSTRPLRCRIVGLLRKREAVVVEVLGADDEWHPAVSGLAPSESPSPAVTSAHARLSATTLEQAAMNPDGLPGTAGDCFEANSQVQSKSSTFADSPPFGQASSPYQRAERAIRFEQQTSRDMLLQEELLVQQVSLLRKVLPHEHAAQLKALQQLYQQHPQLHAYQQHLHSYPDALQEEAIGALALLPLGELATFMRLRKGEPLQPSRVKVLVGSQGLSLTSGNSWLSLLT